MQDSNLPYYNDYRSASVHSAFEDGSEASTAAPSVDIPRLLRKYGPLAVPLFFLGAVAGLLVAAYRPPVYKARALLEVQPLNSSVLRLQGLDTVAGDVDLQTEARKLTSNVALRQVVERLQFESMHPAPERPGILSSIRRFLKINPSQEIPVEILKEGLDGPRVAKSLVMAVDTLEAVPLERTHLIELSCDSTDPDTASNFLNALADEYIQKNIQNRMQTVQLTSQWLTQQLEESKNKMLEAERRLQAFVARSGNVFSSQERQEKEDTPADSQLRALQGQVSAAESDLLLKQSRHEMINHTAPDALPDVLNDPNVRSYQAQIANLRRDEAYLLTTLTPANPKVRRIESQIQDLQGSMKAETEAAVKRIANEYETSKRNRDLLKNAYAAQATRVTAQGNKFVEYSALKRESESARQLYNTMLLQANQSNIVGSLPVNNIRLTEPSVPPLRPYKPKPLTIIGAGAAAGLAICCVIGFALESSDKRVNSPRHARLLFNIPQLGVIPSVAELRQTRRFLPGIGGNSESEDRPASNLIIGGNGDESSTISPVYAQRPLLAESFRVTLASLMRESAGAHRPKVILVTSPGPSEGKTTIASNLAVALAETGRKVLVLDADFRRPRVHKVFGLPNTHGVGDLLNEKLPVAAAPRETLGVRTAVPNLLILPNGTRTENISMALYSPRFRALLQRLKTEFDTILIDAPPLLQVADARVISEMADGVVLVIRVGVTDKGSVQEALEQLRSDRAVVLGTVLNDMRLTKSEAKNRYYYSMPDSPA